MSLFVNSSCGLTILCSAAGGHLSVGGDLPSIDNDS